MNCEQAQRNISSWLDGELRGIQKVDLEAHLRGCALCREESNALKNLCGMLREDKPFIGLSKNFNTVFWSKVSERKKIPWFARILKDPEFFIPAPNLRQAVVFALLAFFMGNVGGFASILRNGVVAGNSTASTQYFSNLQEFNSIPPYSLAASYLKTSEKGTFE